MACRRQFHLRASNDSLSTGCVVPTEDRNHYIQQSLLQEVVMRCAIRCLAAMLILAGIVSAETITLKDGTKHNWTARWPLLSCNGAAGRQNVARSNHE